MPYTGDKCCPGCGKSGKESTRYSVTDLCYKCSDLLKLGRLTAEQNKLSNEWVRLTVYEFHIWDGQSREGEKVWIKLRDMINTLGDSTKPCQESVYVGAHGHNRAEAVVTKIQAQSIKEFYIQLTQSFKAQFDNGKKEGSNLLISLHNGDLTMKKFDELRK